MKRKQSSRSSWLYAILIAAAVMGMSLLLSQVPAQAAVSCLTVSSTSRTDTDGDGFTDYNECNGITLKDNTKIYTDPNIKDLFVILVRKTPTLIPPQSGNPMYWFEFVSNPVGQSTGQFGLGLAVHEIAMTQAQSDRTVCSTCQIPANGQRRQKAVKVSESLDQSADNTFGYTTSCGTPNGPDLTTVYTKKIQNLLFSINELDQLDLYIKHTIAHEIGHMVGPLAPVSGYHYESADNDLIMDQSVYQEGNFVFIGTQYTTGDQAGVRLK
jgi:hypothetical protein